MALGQRNLVTQSAANVLQRSRVGGDLVLVFGQLHLIRGEGPAAVRIAVHFDDGALEAEVISHLLWHNTDRLSCWIQLLK